jgi:hypothetical protein
MRVNQIVGSNDLAECGDPQGLKPTIFLARDGTAEAVSFPKRSVL